MVEQPVLAFGRVERRGAVVNLQVAATEPWPLRDGRLLALCGPSGHKLGDWGHDDVPTLRAPGRSRSGW